MTTTVISMPELGKIKAAQSRPSRESTTQAMKRASMEELLGTAAAVVADVTVSSNVFDSQIERRVPKFSAREVAEGKIIGRGGFCVVRDVDRIHVKSSTKSNGNSSKKNINQLNDTTTKKTQKSAHRQQTKSKSGFSFRIFKRGDTSNRDDASLAQDFGLDNTEELKFSRDYIASKSKKTRSKTSCYVIKSVANNLEKINYMKGNVDIALEAKFLSALSHDNIIELVGVSQAEPCTPGYFLILEKMTETLSQRIKAWMDQDRLTKGVTSIFFNGKKREQKLYRERIEASYDVANALYYLHSRNIIFRDLKPDNIGFDANGTLKLFDFGLAKELLEKDLRRDGTYRNLTSMTGALRYMAPEVGLGQPYNLTADVYSWSMLMWFILALEPPFGFYTESMIKDRVMVRGSRPAIFKRWNEIIGEMLRCAWDADISVRPSFLEISLVLKQELIDCETGTLADGSTAAGSYTQKSSSNMDDVQASYHSRLSHHSRMSRSNSRAEDMSDDDLLDSD